MNYREVTMLAEKTLGDAGTEPIDIDLTEPITELGIYFAQNNPAATHLDDAPPEKSISKIEIVDGGKTVFSLTGQEAVGVAVPELGKWVHRFYNSHLGQNTWVHIPIRFGRFLGDTEFGFDPTKLGNPQLKITYALGGHLSTYNKLAVFAKVMSGVPSPAQCLVWRAIRGYTSASSGSEPTELPVDYPYRKLMVRGWVSGGTHSNIITQYKLTCDVDRLTVFDLSAKTMFAIVANTVGEFYNEQIAVLGGSKSIQSYLSPVLAVSVSPTQISKIGTGQAMWGDNVIVGCTAHDGGAAEVGCHIRSFGLNPHSCLQYEFGDPNKPETWFRSSQYKSVKAILTHGAAAAISIAVNQPVNLTNL